MDIGRRSLGRGRALGVALWRRDFPFIMAVTCWTGAALPVGAPMWVAVSGLILGIGSRRRSVAFVLIPAAVSILSFNARAGLEPLADGPWSGRVQLLGEPETASGRVLVDADSAIGRVQLSVVGTARSVVAPERAGARFDVRGTLRPLRHPDRYASRHLRMALTVEDASEVAGRDLWRVPVDALRGAIVDAAEALPVRQRPIYTGFVIGDDRGADADVNETFEESGLTHLLVVSGENVVFVAAIVSAVMARASRRTRLVGSVLALVLFAAVTGFEPSVLRAATMAIIAVVGSGVGRPIEARRRLALAVTLLLILDPLLICSFGFRLSVAASAGITLLAVPIARRVRGPQWFRQVLAVTISAQLAVAPLVVPVFGPLPLASLPANVLADPVAGLVMMWGSSIGLVAGIVGHPLADVLQVPVEMGIWWIMTVAERCASMGLPHVGLAPMAIAVAVVVALSSLRRLCVRHIARRRAAGVGG